MKSATIIGIFSYFFCSIRCTIDEVAKLKSLNITDEKLFFSFDKKNFNDFEFNLSDEILSHETLTKPPFGFCEPLGNFVKVFCLFYQYSLIIHDKEFNENVKKFFECSHEKAEENVTFEDFLNQEDACIKTILKEKNISRQFVTVEEKDGRIICKQNDLVEITFNKLEDSDESYSEDLGLLGPGYFVSLKKLSDEYVFNPSLPILEHPHGELLDLYSKVDTILRANNEKLAKESEENCRKYCEEQLLYSFNRYACLILNRNLNGELPKYLIELMVKVAAKVLYNISDNTDIFTSYSAEYMESLFLLKSHLKKSFEGKNLSDKSIEMLIISCLEKDVEI